MYSEELAHMFMKAEKPKICFSQAEDPGEPMVSLSSKFEALQTRIADAVNSNLSTSPEEEDHVSSETVRQGERILPY